MDRKMVERVARQAIDAAEHAADAARHARNAAEEAISPTPSPSVVKHAVEQIILEAAATHASAEAILAALNEDNEPAPPDAPAAPQGDSV